MERKAITWGVYRDGLLGGWVAFDLHTSNAHCVFKKGETRTESFFGHKTTIPALTQIATDLFAVGVPRIGMLVFRSNRALQSLIKALGGDIEAIYFNPRTMAGETVLPNGNTEPEPMLQYGLYRNTFGTPQAQGLTYNEWLSREKNEHHQAA